MNAAVFLDRDNTIIHNDGDLGDPSKVRLIQGAASAVASLKGLGYRIIVVSNQGGVARGKFTEADVEAVNHRINELIYANSGVAIDRFYYCPYHPEGTEDRYRREHPWRKPRPGMLLQAAKDFGLDLTQSWIIGDQMRDVQAGFSARVIPILLLERGEPPGPTAAIPPAAAEDRHAGATVMIEPALDYFVVRNLVEAVRLIGQKARPTHVAAAMKANRTVVVPKVQPRVSTSAFDPNMVNALAGGGTTPNAGAQSTPTSASVDEGITSNQTDATAEIKEAATMKPGVRDIERLDGSSHDALPEQAVEARGQIEELIAAAGEARRVAARPPSPPSKAPPGDAPDLFGADPPPPRPDASRNTAASREPAQAKAPSPRSLIVQGQEGDQSVALRDPNEGEADTSRGAAGAFETAPDIDIPRPTVDGKASGGATVKRRQRGSARAEEARPDAATSPPRSASGRREVGAMPSPSDRPAPPAPHDDDPAQPSAEHTLRQILQELRNQRVVSGDFSWTTVLALVLQMMTIVCIAAALLMGGGNGDLFMRWMACAIILQLATLTMMLVRR